jgi:hypothetical protein
MDLLSFDKESVILNDKPNFSILEYGDTHGFTPESLETKKNVLGIYQNSVIQEKKELILEYICKVQGLYYIYLTLDSIPNNDNKDSYKMRLYYDFKDRQQINLLLTSLKK